MQTACNLVEWLYTMLVCSYMEKYSKFKTNDTSLLVLMMANKRFGRSLIKLVSKANSEILFHWEKKKRFL